MFLIVSGCKKDEFETVKETPDRKYFNQSIGSYSVYSVYEVIYDDFTNSIDTFEYQLKELNQSYFTDNLGRKAVRIERYKRNNDTADWTFLNTWYSVSDSLMAERVEDNKRFIKLSFPISSDAVWNSNALNMDNVNNVYYGMRHNKYKLDSFSFDSVVSIESNTINNSFRERAFKEIYAKHIGLIYKNFVFIDKMGSLVRGSRTVLKLRKHVP